MQEKTTISRWISILNSFKDFRINILMILTFGLLSNQSFAQLALEQFSSGIPATWAVASSQTVTNNWVPTTPTGGYLNTPGVMVNPSLNNTAGTTAEYFLITPLFNTPPPNTEVRFFTKQGSFINKGATYEVRLSVNSQPDLDSFNVVLGTWTEAQLNNPATTWTEKIVTIPSLPQGIPVYLAFVAITNQDASNLSNTSGDTWFIDNVRVITSCAPVTGISSTMSSNGGIINWTHPTASNFEIQIVSQGSGIAASGTPVTGTSFNATTLTNGNPFVDGTNYDVYIKTICDATTSSSWAGPFNIQTSVLGLNCGTPVVIPTTVGTGTPYVLNSNLANYYSATDYTAYTTVGSSCFPAGTSNQLSGNHVFFTYTPTTDGLIDITQAVNVVSGGGGNNCYNTLSSIMVYNSCADVGANCLAAVMTTGSGSSTVQIPNFYVQGGHTYVIVMSSPFQHTNPGAGICFTFSVSGSTCPAPSPSSTTYSNLTQTSANFSWANVGNLVNKWDYIVLPASAPAPTGSTTGFTTTTSNVNQPAGVILSPATDYKLYVRSVCGAAPGTPGNWSAGFPFRTPCNVLPLNYYTGFNDATLNDACWSQLNLNNDNDFFTLGGTALGGPGGPVAKLRVGTAGDNTNDMLISPQFHLTTGAQKRLRFKFNNYGNWGSTASNPAGGPCTFEVKMSTSGAGAQSFTIPVLPLVERITAYNFVEITVPLPDMTADINLAWILPAGANQEGIQFYLDDVYIEDMPACSEPSYPVITQGSITTTTAEVSWNAGYQNTQWQLVAQPLGTGTPVLPGGPGVIVYNNVTSNPFTMTGLVPSTRYEFYVRAYCSASAQSTWVGPINFNTLCIAQPTPYYESFNDTDVNTKKFCWATNNVDGDPAQWKINGTEATITPNPINFFNPFVGYNDWLISAPVNAVGPKRLRFNYRVLTSFVIPTSPRGNFEVLMSSTPDFSTYTTLIPMHDFTNSSYLEDEVLFTGTGLTYIAFRMPSNMPNPTQTGIVMVDDFVIEDAPACPNPSDLAIANITQTTANLSWLAGYLETKWEVVVQSQGNGIPTSSGTVVNTTPAYNAINLAPDTAYEYYVKAICNPTDSSEWVGPFKFRTICNVLPTPFIETFDTNSTTETCWTIYNNNADNNTWNLNQTVNPIFGDQMAALFTGMNGNNNDWLITPTLNAHAGQRLRFYYKTYSSNFEEDLKVMLSTTGVAPSAFASNIMYENNFTTTVNAAGTTTGSNVITVTDGSGVKVGDTFYILGFPIPYATTVTNVSGNTITVSNAATLTMAGPLHIVFTHEVINNVVEKEMVINLDDHYTFTGNTNINIAFHTPYFPPNPWNYRGQYTFIDNVIVEDVPACPSVINVTTQNITDVTAQTNWEAVGTEASWEISLQPYGTPAPAGNTLPAYLISTNAHPYNFSNLTPATHYQYYVRAICSGTSQSTWVGPFEFTTRCDFTNACQYTFTVSNGNTGQVYRALQVKQNETVVQELTFPVVAPNQPTSIDYQVYLCNGVAFDVYWDGFGNGTQYSQAQLVIKDASNNIVWTSPQGLGTIHTNIYTGFASCGTITCPQPTNLAVSNQGVLSWTAGASETQWEVYVQPVENGTLPQATSNIHLVNTTNYTPTVAAGDFVNGTAGTYEFFVRAVCGPNNKSFWFGPKVFVRNDEPGNALRLTPNTSTTCVVSGTDASFVGATPSSEPTSCAGVNGGDIWYDFIATSRVHNIELSDFTSGSYYQSSGDGPWPKVIMSLYEVQPNGSLVEKACSDNNSITTTYSSELVVGNTYKIRLKLNSAVASDKRFHICITTPVMCDLDAFNYDFEKFPMQVVTGVSTIVDATVVPGWRVNTTSGSMFYLEGNNIGITPYSGGQCVQLIQDGAATWNPSDPNVKGLYKDFETSLIPVMDYSFASATRNSSGTKVQLYAGPPAGPFTMIAEDYANSNSWDLIKGSYITNSQPITRFIFRVEGNAIGHILDAANFKPNTDIKTVDATLDCSQSSINVEAVGLGEWVASATNPSVATIANPTNPITTISNITTPGVYSFIWKTRYCEKVLNVTLSGFSDVPTVTSPVTYCTSDTATALTATAPAGYTLIWYTQAIGGTGDVNAPTPSTATIGTTTYYVALVNGTGCIGTRVAIDVVVNPLITPVVQFAYDNTTYCANGANPVFVPASGFTTGGTFSALPAGLSINANTGAINLSASAVGNYLITYNLPVNGCVLSGSSTANIVIVNEVTFALQSVCENHAMVLNVIPTNGSDLSTVDYTWEDGNGNTIGTNASQFNVNEYLALNTGLAFPLTFTVIVDSEGCLNTKQITLENNNCGLIPRGISPNSDGDNDTFDLTGLGVREISIFNRYGTEVYTFSGIYTNQWNGNAKNGSHLPDGTYFYSLTLQDGKSITGWVYILRQN